ncbi:MAG TPA: hypothetical protein VHJ78_04330 [Actinomycetota bacterium]|nr:hypothetical protein [Actinomycetota bacterium]
MRSPSRRLCAVAAAMLVIAGTVTSPAANAAAPQLIAFTAALSGPLNLGGIFVMRPDGSEVRQLTSFSTVVFDYEAHGLNLPDDHPSFAPDGRRIAFTSSREGGDFEIYVMDVNGADVRRLTTNPGLDTEPVFSPDGRKTPSRPSGADSPSGSTSWTPTAPTCAG